ncbi:Hypothetical predicted protein [Mytilus galloprovincialis]|uniref:Crossover junction endonuclease MUS81 n=1 Tax=Mytilus galloprovincialis TaxID=29158 RepID=A0A8B6GS36_MYTGA|nr:Hypothetical predicted protein [Mytilus galloprovincialis]
MAGKRKYTDLKYKFIRGLQRQEVYQRTKHWLKSSAECTSRAIVSLELCERPVKSTKQAEKLEGIGAEIKKKLEKIKEDDFVSEDPPVRGRFVSSAGAILMALLEATELAYSEGHSKDSSVLVPEDVVKTKAKEMCDEQLLDLENEDTTLSICPAWWRVEILIKRDLVKRRIFNKAPVYVLLPSGTEEALKLRERSGRLPVSGSHVIPWSTVPDHNDVLYTNYDGSDGVVLLVDISEMGGDRVGLGDLCRMIEGVNIKYKTRKLLVGDYSWVWNCDGTERILPFLVERKRADDVARTLKEGRFWTQVIKMVAWKQQFAAQGIQCQLQYIVEGEPEQYMVKCMDGCQGVGMCGNPTVIQVKNALKDLRSHPDLNVQQTENLQDTVIMLASITIELQQRVKKGDFDEMVVKELNSKEGGKKKKEFYIIDSDNEDDVAIINDKHDSNHPVRFDTQDVFIEETVETSPSYKKVNFEKNRDKQSNTGAAKKINFPKDSLCIKNSTQIHLSPDAKKSTGFAGKTNTKSDIPQKERKKSAVPFEELPLEPFVQYHCSKGIQATPPKRRNTPSKYHVPGAYKPKMDYIDDSVFDNNNSGLYIATVNNTKYQRKTEDNYTTDSWLDVKNKTLKHKLDNNDTKTESVGKKYCPRTKVFKLKSVSTASENESIENPISWSDEEQPSTSAFSPKSNPNRRTVRNTSIDSAISSEEEASTSKQIDNFIKTVKSKNRKKFDSALSDSDSDDLPDLNFNVTSPVHSTYQQSHLSDTNSKGPKIKAPGTKQKYVFLTTEQKQNVQTVKCILPQLSDDDVKSALQRHSWNVDLTISELLDTVIVL